MNNMICKECKECYYFRGCKNRCYGFNKPCKWYITPKEEVEKRQREMRI